MSFNNLIDSGVELGPVASSSRSNDHLTSPIQNPTIFSLPVITVDHISPPIPAYSPHSAIDIPTYEPPTLLSDNVTPNGTGTDSDFIENARMHDHHEEAGVVRRLPELFPSDFAALRSSQPPKPLPPYRINDPPPYRRRIDHLQGEPDTLAMVFFKSGFFFPAFWLFGALMLVTPLRSPNPFEPQAALSQISGWPPRTEFIAWCNENLRTEEDKAEYLAKMHAAEMKWAKRCLLALVLLLCFAVAIGVTIFAVLKVQK